VISHQIRALSNQRPSCLVTNPASGHPLQDALFSFSEDSGHMTTKALLTEARKLSEKDRIRLANEIWKTVEENWIDPEMPEWQKNELDRRIENHKRNPSKTVSWAQVERKIARLSRSKK
jgi:putative addiction module component (TIGR02574 family)